MTTINSSLVANGQFNSNVAREIDAQLDSLNEIVKVLREQLHSDASGTARKSRSIHTRVLALEAKQEAEGERIDRLTRVLDLVQHDAGENEPIVESRALTDLAARLNKLEHEDDHRPAASEESGIFVPCGLVREMYYLSKRLLAAVSIDLDDIQPSEFCALRDARAQANALFKMLLEIRADIPPAIHVQFNPEAGNEAAS